MSALKIVRLLSIAVAVVGAFVAIPEAALVMAVLGLTWQMKQIKAIEPISLYSQ